MRPALVLCNGEPPSRTLIRRLVRAAGLFVAADGGANAAARLGVRPDVIIGDLDSITPATRRRFREATVLYSSRQDNTDLEKALDFLVARGCRRVTVAGAAGRRIDFTIGNLSVAWRYADRLAVEFAGDDWTAMPVGKSRIVHARPGTVVSLLPFGRCSGVTLRGLEYPLTDAAMDVGHIGVSNVVRRSPFSVRVARGAMLMVVLAPPFPLLRHG